MQVPGGFLRDLKGSEIPPKPPPIHRWGSLLYSPGLSETILSDPWTLPDCNCASTHNLRGKACLLPSSLLRRASTLPLIAATMGERDIQPGVRAPGDEWNNVIDVCMLVRRDNVAKVYDFAAQVAARLPIKLIPMPLV